METQDSNSENKTEYLEASLVRGAEAAQSLHRLGYRLGEMGLLVLTAPTDCMFNSEETGSGTLITSYSVASGVVTCTESGWGVITTKIFLSSADVKNVWSYVFTQTLFMTWCLVQRMDGTLYIILDKNNVSES
jgi:hypothetical protein